MTKPTTLVLPLPHLTLTSINLLLTQFNVLKFNSLTTNESLQNYKQHSLHICFIFVKYIGHTRKA